MNNLPSPNVALGHGGMPSSSHQLQLDDMITNIGTAGSQPQRAYPRSSTMTSMSQQLASPRMSASSRRASISSSASKSGASGFFNWNRKKSGGGASAYDDDFDDDGFGGGGGGGGGVELGANEMSMASIASLRDRDRYPTSAPAAAPATPGERSMSMSSMTSGMADTSPFIPTLQANPGAKNSEYRKNLKANQLMMSSNEAALFADMNGMPQSGFGPASPQMGPQMGQMRNRGSRGTLPGQLPMSPLSPLGPKSPNSPNSAYGYPNGYPNGPNGYPNGYQQRPPQQRPGSRLHSMTSSSLPPQPRYAPGDRTYSMNSNTPPFAPRPQSQENGPYRPSSAHGNGPRRPPSAQEMAIQQQHLQNQRSQLSQDATRQFLPAEMIPPPNSLNEQVAKSSPSSAASSGSALGSVAAAPKLSPPTTAEGDSGLSPVSSSEKSLEKPSKSTLPQITEAPEVKKPIATMVDSSTMTDELPMPSSSALRNSMASSGRLNSEYDSANTNTTAATTAASSPNDTIRKHRSTTSSNSNNSLNEQLLDEIRLLSSELADSLRREFNVEADYDEGMESIPTESLTPRQRAQKLTMLQTQLDVERRRRVIAENNSGSGASSPTTLLAEALSSSAEKDRILQSNELEMKSLRDTIESMKDDYSALQSETEELKNGVLPELHSHVENLELLTAAGNPIELLKEIEDLKVENLKMEKLVEENSTRGPLGDKLKAVEEQRDALREALRSLRERKDHELRQNEDRIKQLESRLEKEKLLHAQMQRKFVQIPFKLHVTPNTGANGPSPTSSLYQSDFTSKTSLEGSWPPLPGSHNNLVIPPKGAVSENRPSSPMTPVGIGQDPAWLDYVRKG